MPRKIALIGEGGLGVQTVAKVLAESAKKSGKFASYLPSFGVEQRGGVSIAYVQIGSHPISFPRFRFADIVVAFSNRAIDASLPLINDKTLFIYDDSAIEGEILSKLKNNVKLFLKIPARKIAQEKFSPKSTNIILLGALVSNLKEIDYQQVEQTLRKELAGKIEVGSENQIADALKTGANCAERFDQANEEFSGKTFPEIKKIFENEKVIWTRFPKYCKGCSLCIEKCPQKALSFSNDLGFLGNPLPQVDLEKCIACQSCQKICPDGAIKVEGK